MPELDARLRDDAAMDEIELVSRVIIAASEAKEKLTECELDAILGVASA